MAQSLSATANGGLSDGESSYVVMGRRLFHDCLRAYGAGLRGCGGETPKRSAVLALWSRRLRSGLGRCRLGGSRNRCHHVQHPTRTDQTSLTRFVRELCVCPTLSGCPLFLLHHMSQLCVVPK